MGRAAPRRALRCGVPAAPLTLAPASARLRGGGVVAARSGRAGGARLPSA